MKIRDLILAVLVAGMVISTGTLVLFASSGISDVKNITSEASSGELLNNASKNLEAVAISIRNSLDNNMQSQYEMVKTWSREPTLAEVAVKAQSHSVAELFEMWSAEATRLFNNGEAKGDGNPNNDLSPFLSKYFNELTNKFLFSEVFMTDHRGYVVAASGATSDFDQGPDNWKVFNKNGAHVLEKDNPGEFGEAWFEACRQALSRSYVSDVIWDESSKTSGIEIVRQVVDPVSGKYIGVLKTVYAYSKFLDKFVNVDELGVYEVKVVGKNGRILATTKEDKTKIDNSDFNVGDQIKVVSVIDLNYGNFPNAFKDENGEQVYAAYAKSTDQYGYLVIVTKKASAVAAPIDKFVGSMQNNISEKSAVLQRNMIIIGAAVAIIILAIAFFIMRAKVSIPLKKLTVISDKLANGEIEGLEIDVHGKDEISSFGEHFKGVLAAFNFLKDEAESKK